MDLGQGHTVVQVDMRGQDDTVVQNATIHQNCTMDQDNVTPLTEVQRYFIEIMKHSIKCRSCDDTKCKKMTMVMSHYIKCTKLKDGENCLLCRQLLRVVAEHALYLCPNRVDGSKLPCPVPMCDVMRASAALKSLN